MPLPLPSSDPGDADPGDADRRTPLPPPPAAPRTGSGSSEAMTCYRHADREVGRRCTRCGKPACADCLRQMSVGSHCLECVKAAKPDIATRAKHWQASRPTIITTVIIGINLAVFIGLGLFYDIGGMLGGQSTEAHLRYALFNELRFTNGATLTLGDSGEWYRLVTSGFLHYGIIHIGFNMYFLYILGNQMEPQLGRVRFIALYAASLLGGSAGALLIDQGGLTAGASGAVFGLLGATAIGMYQHGVNPLRTQIGTLLMINLGLTFFVGGISIGGHVGGLIAGAICGFITMAPGYKGYPNWARLATPVAVGVVAVAVSVVIAS